MGMLSTSGATRCLEVDHQRLDAILIEVERAAGAGRFAEARERFARFASGLVRHIDAEEKVLFPVLEEAEPRAGGPISVMRSEHEELRQILDAIASAFAVAAPGWQDLLLRLKEVLITHNTKEERMLYPMADEAAQSMRRSDVLAEGLRAALAQACP